MICNYLQLTIVRLRRSGWHNFIPRPRKFRRVFVCDLACKTAAEERQPFCQTDAQFQTHVNQLIKK